MIRQIASAWLIALTAMPGLSAEAELPPTGLEFATPTQLRGVPLAELPFAGFELPARVDLSEHMPRPGLQGRQNSCVAWVSAYAVKTYQEKIEQRYTLTTAGRPDWQRIFSPAFVYNQINQGRDGGATLIDALNLLSGRGSLAWAEMPYDVDNFTRMPSAEQLKAARRYRIAYWRQVNVNDQAELKAHLLAGYPIMIGAMVDESLYRLKPGTVWKRSGGKSLGGHAMVLVGYDEHRQAFKLMNSWGDGWAEHGFGWVDYRHLGRVIREGYVAKDALNDRPVEMVMRDAERGGEAAGSSPPQPVPSVVGQVEDGVRSRHPAGSDAAEPEARPTASEAPGSRPEEDKKADLAKSETGRTRQSEGSRAQAPPRRHQDRLFDIDQLDPGMLSNLDDREPIMAQSEEAMVEPLRLLRQQIEGDQLLLSGQALLDPEAGGLRAQVLVRFYFDAAATRPVPALNVAYALPDGTAVAVSPEQAADTRLLHWQARIPLSQLPQELHSLWLKPVLYLDRFGVERGEMVKISL